MKNILITCDSFIDGGLENRILNEVEYYKKNNINVYLATKNFNSKHQHHFTKIFKFTSIDFYKNDCLDIPKLLESLNSLKHFCLKNHIDYIECHPFTSSIISILTASHLQIPISYTLHGLTSGDFIPHYQINLKTIYYFILKYGTDKFFSVAEYLNDYYSFLSNDITISRNGFTLEKNSSNISKNINSDKIAIASRLDEPKTNLIYNFLPIIKTCPKIKQIDIYGDGDQLPSLKDYINKNHIANINIKGWTNNLTKAFSANNYLAIFGMGKIVLDAINANLPIGILGYNGFCGFVTNETIDHFAKYNLTSWDTTNPKNLSIAIEKIQKNPKSFLINKSKLSSFDETKILETRLITTKSISYHKKTNLNLLSNIIAEFKTNTPISKIINKLNQSFDSTFDPYYRALALQSSRIAHLEQELHQTKSNNLNLNQQLSDILNSRFWKSTSRIRKALSPLHSPKNQQPEIIAVLCTYNEETNIDGCLKHLEPYVDKIVIFDDGSKDKTVKKAKKHRKVVSVIQNRQKEKWNERLNRETVIKKAYTLAKNKNNAWALCIDGDERYETNFLINLRKIATEHQNSNVAICVHFRELWDNINQYRIDGIWNEKRKAIFFKLSPKMTFNHKHEHHIPWYYEELNANELLLNYNLYHLKMVKPLDRKKRVKLYNELDPNKEMQPIGYDYLVDTNNLKLEQIKDNHLYNTKTVPKYYK